MIELPVERSDERGTRSGLWPAVQGHIVMNNMLIEAQFRYDCVIAGEPTYLHLSGYTYSLFGDDKFGVCSYIMSHDAGFIYLLVAIHSKNFVGLRRLDDGASSLRTLDGRKWRQPERENDDCWRCDETRYRAKLAIFIPARDNVTHLKLKEDVIPMAKETRKKRAAQLALLEEWRAEEEKRENKRVRLSVL